MPDLQADSRNPQQSPSRLAALHVDQGFLRSRRGIILGSELVLLLLMFICYAASTVPLLTVPLLFLIIHITFAVTYLSRYQEKMNRINWPCIDFLRACVTAVIFFIVSITSAAKRTGAGSQSAAVFGFILTGVLVYDAYDSYRKIISDQVHHEGPQSSQSSNLDAE